MPARAHHDDLDKSQYRAILDGVQDALFVTDPDGNVAYMNRAAIHLYGFEEREEEERESINLQRYALEHFEVSTLEGDPIPDDDRPLMRALRGEAY